MSPLFMTVASCPGNVRHRTACLRRWVRDWTGGSDSGSRLKLTAITRWS